MKSILLFLLTTQMAYAEKLFLFSEKADKLFNHRVQNEFKKLILDNCELQENSVIFYTNPMKQSSLDNPMEVFYKTTASVFNIVSGEMDLVEIYLKKLKKWNASFELLEFQPEVGNICKAI